MLRTNCERRKPTSRAPSPVCPVSDRQAYFLRATRNGVQLEGLLLRRASAPSPAPKKLDCSTLARRWKGRQPPGRSFLFSSRLLLAITPVWVSRVSVSGFMQALYFPALAFQPASSARQHQYALRELHAEQEVVRTTSARSSGWHRCRSGSARYRSGRLPIAQDEGPGSTRCEARAEEDWGEHGGNPPSRPSARSRG